MPAVKMGRGKVGFSVARSYKASLENVWNGVTQARHLKKFFVDAVKGDMTADLKPVIWVWKGYDAATLHLTACKPHERIEFHWKAEGVKYHTRIRIEFSRVRGRVLLQISEWGWTARDLESAFSHCTGWTDFVDYLKAYLIYGLDFRK